MPSNIDNGATPSLEAGGLIAENAPEILCLNAASNRLERKVAAGASRIVRAPAFDAAIAVGR